MSHEIRTPMNGVIGMTELGPRNRRSRRAARVPRAWSRTRPTRCSGVINDILDFSKIEARKLELASRSTSTCATSLGDALQPLAVRAHEKGLELTLPRRRRSVPDAPGRRPRCACAR